MTDDPSSETKSNGLTVNPKLLELLVCPLTKSRLSYDPAAQELISRAAGLAFPIRSGVPILIEDAARKLTDDDLKRKS